jgi:hypothetical protein
MVLKLILSKIALAKPDVSNSLVFSDWLVTNSSKVLDNDSSLLVNLGVNPSTQIQKKVETDSSFD